MKLTHAVGSVNLGQLHAAHNQAGNNFTSSLDNGVLGRVHVQAAHAAQLLNALHADESLDAEGTHGAVVAGGRDDERRVDGVGVHARLVVVVHRHQRPVGDDTSDAHTLLRRAGDEVLDAGGVEHLNVGQRQHLGHDGRSEEGGVLDDNVVALILVRDANLAEEGIGRLAHNHGREQLAAQPGAAAGGDGRLDDGNLEVRALLAQDVGGRQAARAGADNDNVRLGVLVQVLEVAAGHGPGDLRLADGRKLEAVPLAEHVFNVDLGVALGLGRSDSGSLGGRDGQVSDALGRGNGGWGAHDEWD